MSYEFALSSELPPLNEHPVYQAGMAQIAGGQWKQALQSFQLLKDVYPDDAEVKELLDQVQMRAALAQFQPRQSSRTAKSLNPRWLAMGVLVTVIVVVAAYVAYEVWINPVIVQEFRLRQITSLRNDADEAMAVGDYSRARQSLQKLQVIYPEDPQTLEALRRIEQIERASLLYDEAKAHVEAGNWGQAIESLAELQSLDAEYRDLSQLLQIAQASQALDRQFGAAEEAFARGDWAGAIVQYVALRETDLTFRFEKIQARLFDAYLKHGQMVLGESGIDPKQVSEAISYFSEALKIRPMDDEALGERRLAETYLAALDSKDQDEVIDLLQMIYNERPGYAGNQAAQLLYATLLEQGESLLKSGDQAAAIAAYQTAAQLLVEDPSEAQQKLSELTSKAVP